MFKKHGKKIIDYLVANGPSTGREIQVGLGMSVARFYVAAERLERDGELTYEVVDRKAVYKYRQNLYSLPASS